MPGASGESLGIPPVPFTDGKKEKHHVFVRLVRKKPEIYIASKIELFSSFWRGDIKKKFPKKTADEIDDLKKQYDSTSVGDGVVIKLILLDIATRLSDNNEFCRPKTNIIFGNERTIDGYKVGYSVAAAPLSIYPPSMYRGSETSGNVNGLYAKLNRNRRGAFVQGHLLNYHLHGPAKEFNLTPITTQANGHMQGKWENTLKDMVIKENKVIEVEITAHYGKIMCRQDLMLQKYRRVAT